MGRQLVWHDEFDKPHIDAEKWCFVHAMNTSDNEYDNSEKYAQYGITEEDDFSPETMPSLWSPDFSSKSVTDFIEQANKIAEQFEKYGLNFTYHHHDREFSKIGNETIMDILVRELNKKNISFVLDTYWLQTGGVSILEWLGRLEGRVKILHLKDYVVPFGKSGGSITELGSGNINFKDVIKAAEVYGVEDLCYEQDNAPNGDSLASAKQSAEYFYSII